MNALAMIERCGRHGTAEGLRALPWKEQQEFREGLEQSTPDSPGLPKTDRGRPDAQPLSCEDVGWD